jgi:peptidoglycan hydrolase-like amidase
MKKQASLVLIVGVISAGLGAYVQKRHDQQAVTKSVSTNKTHTKTTVKQVRHKDGTVETTKVIITDKDSKSTEIQKIPVKTSKINVSVLAGTDVTSRFKPEYGISINKEFIGPVTIGAFGMTNGVLGVSIGITF